MKWLWQQLGRLPLASALLKERAVLLGLLGFAFVYLLLSLFEVQVWRCLWEALTGWRCPGCGLTRGCKAFLRGDLREGLSSNWFTPFVMLGLIVCPVYLALPRDLSEKWRKKLETFEKRFRVAFVLILLLIAQTIARLSGWT